MGGIFQMPPLVYKKNTSHLGGLHRREGAAPALHRPGAAAPHPAARALRRAPGARRHRGRPGARRSRRARQGYLLAQGRDVGLDGDAGHVAAGRVPRRRLRRLQASRAVHTTSFDLGDEVTVSLDRRRTRSILRCCAPFFRARGAVQPALIGPARSSAWSAADPRGVAALGSEPEVFESGGSTSSRRPASDLNLSFVVDESDADRLVQRLTACSSSPSRRPGAGPNLARAEAGASAARKSAGALWTRRERRCSRAPPARRSTSTNAQTLDASSPDQASRDRSRALRVKPTQPETLRLWSGRGSGSSALFGEIDHVLGTMPGLAPERVLFTPNFAPRVEYERAFERGVRVTVDAVFPLLEWPEVFKGREIFVRFDPGHGRGHHPHVRTAGVQSKFGSRGPPRWLLEAVARLRRERSSACTPTAQRISHPETWAETARFSRPNSRATLPECRFSIWAAVSESRSARAGRARGRRGRERCRVQGGAPRFGL